MAEVIFPKSVKDNVLRSVSYEDIITAVQSNEPFITEEVIRNVYNEIVKQNLEDAMHVLNEDMDFLLSHLDS